LVIGIPGIFGNEFRHIARDISYALTPISLIYMGFWLSDRFKDYKSFFRITVIAGLFIAIVHLGMFVIQPSIFTQEISFIRDRASNPNVVLVALALILGFFSRRFKMDNLFPKFIPKYFGLAILLLSLILSFSRTSIVILFIMTISAWGIMGKINKKAMLIIFVIMAAFLIIVVTTPKDDVKTFRGKFARIFRELSLQNFSKINEVTWNWRGYETLRALDTFSSGNVFQVIAGHGFGSLVDLKMTMNLAGVDFKSIPILHNGYAYLLVKTGLIGLFSYLFFYYFLLRKTKILARSEIDQNKGLAKILLGSSLSLITTMFVVGGMAEVHNSELVLTIGYIISVSGKLN
jgi:O-antigen ligase